MRIKQALKHLLETMTNATVINITEETAMEDLQTANALTLLEKNVDLLEEPLNYQATGELIGHLPYEGDRVVILVKRGDEYVVSTYRNGASEWESGNYFRDPIQAVDKFYDKSKQGLMRVMPQPAMA